MLLKLQPPRKLLKLPPLRLKLMQLKPRQPKKPPKQLLLKKLKQLLSPRLKRKLLPYVLQLRKQWKQLP